MENYSLADLAAVTGANDGFGCGGNGGILSWLLIFALLGGGGLGFGFGGNNRGNYRGPRERI